MANEKRLIEYYDVAYQIQKLQMDAFRNVDKASCMAYRKALDILRDAPTVEAVEVVRCKDCKHYKPQNQGAHRNCTTPFCMRVVTVKVSPEAFCSYGERREGE